MGCQGVIDVQLEPLSGDALRAEIDRLAELRARSAVRLLVCGAGADAIPVVRLAAMTGWLVTVVDHRPSFATAERFPDADACSASTRRRRMGCLASVVRLDEFAAAVVMGHAATHDRARLHELLGVRQPALPRRARSAPAHDGAARGRARRRARRASTERLRSRRARHRRRDSGGDRARDRERMRGGARGARAEAHCASAVDRSTRGDRAPRPLPSALCRYPVGGAP